jgi:hypothetical protein
MKRSHAVVAIAVVVALCTALPAVGAAPNPVKLAKKALKIGKKADKRARKASRTAGQALTIGRAADGRARQALGVLAGSVPNATRAQSAAVADSLRGIEIVRFNTRVAPSATATPQSAARAAAQRVPLIAEGPITVYGKCFVDSSTPGNPLVSAEIFVETSVGGVVYSADNGSSSNGFLDPGTAEADAGLLNVASAAGVGNPGTLNVSDADAGAFYVIAPGLSIQGQLIAGTKVGSPPAGDGVFGPGDACIFAGTANAG